jgi:hypothetical protein
MKFSQIQDPWAKSLESKMTEATISDRARKEAQEDREERKEKEKTDEN